MNRNETAPKIDDENPTDLVDVGATNSHLHTLLEEICAGEEFSILRETLRLYCDEVTIH
jgi:hypothetical protein